MMRRHWMQACGRAVVCGLAAIVIAAAQGSDITSGFRGDGSGKFTRAKPPLHWSAEQNVLWATALPGPSNASPILVNERVFVTAEPDLLICVRASDGKILWERQTNYYTDVDPKQVAVIEAKLKEFDKEIKQIPIVSQQLTEAFAQYEKDPQNQELQQKVKKLNEEHQALYRVLRPLAGFIPPPTFPVIGYTSATPISDGQRVFVVYGTGIVAAYDMDGQRLWHTQLEPPRRHQHGHGSSPVLAGGKLLVHFDELTALDPQTGKVQWSARAEAGWGSPTVARTDAGEFVVTAGGDVLRGYDGQMIARCVTKLDFNGPVVDQGVAYFLQNPATAFDLPTQPLEGVNPAQRWQVELPQDRYTATPIVHDGLAYVVTYHGQLTVLDVADGKKVYEQKLPLTGLTAPSVVLAGGEHLLFSTDAGQTLVIRTGRKFEVVSQNVLEPFRSTPLPADGRLYIRGLKRLFCLQGDVKPPKAALRVSVAR